MIGRLAWLAMLAAIALVAAGAQLDRAARFDPRLDGLVPQPFAAFAAQRRAEMAVRQERSEDALRLARDLVRKRPLPAEHLILLAQAEGLAGNAGPALAAVEAAARRGWREPQSQLAMAEAGLAAGDYDVAAQRVSALWAAGQGEVWTGAITRRLLASEGGGREAFARQLAGEGRWQRNWVTGSGEVAAKERGETLLRSLALGAQFECGGLQIAARQIEQGGEPSLGQRLLAGCR